MELVLFKRGRSESHLPPMTGLGRMPMFVVSRLVGTYVGFFELVLGSTSKNFFILKRHFAVSVLLTALVMVLSLTKEFAIALALV